MNYNEVKNIATDYLLPVASELYGLEGYEMKAINPHNGGRNLVYSCEKSSDSSKILRFAFLKDRSLEDFKSELEYVRYLFEHGGSVANVIDSKKGNLVEEIKFNKHSIFVSLFEKAKGKMLVEHNYQYREGVPIQEYYYNCGKVLGKLHHLAKEYTPIHRRYSFFYKYNVEYINLIIPETFSILKEKLIDLLKMLEELDRNRETYGMVHFDYGDGNFMIDYDTGQITAYDFDDSCFCWYMYELASIWRNGVGWIQFEPDPEKRRKFMNDYFKTVLEGYRSETSIEDNLLEQLPLFIKVVLLEHIVGEFERMKNNGEELEDHKELEDDEELVYYIKCMEEDIPYMGFFHEIYSSEEPFCYNQ